MTTQLETLKNELSRHVVGQERVVERLIISMVANGHCLLEGVPGVGKTMMTSTLARMVGGTFARIQFTPDLMPADIIGYGGWLAALCVLCHVVVRFVAPYADPVLLPIVDRDTPTGSSR